MKSMLHSAKFLLAMLLVMGLAGCGSLFSVGEDSVPPHQRQLPATTQALLAIHGMTQDAPIFVRIFKEESELEIWKLKEGRFQHFKTYPICTWSGGLGPKVRVGDRQAPEGFYTVSANQMNPKSLYHLSFNLGFPNAHDRANAYTGSALMVHGNCKSAGCYAMTDTYIEEIYILARDALAAGQIRFHVQAFPFRMTVTNMERHKDSDWYGFWKQLKEGYDAFEASNKPPVVKVCSKQYLVNVSFIGHATEPAPDAQCPKYVKIDPAEQRSIDGIPPTLYANYSKPSSTAAAPVAVAAAKPASEAKTDPVAVAAAEIKPAISASPVLTQASPPKPVVIASAASSPQPGPRPSRTAPISILPDRQSPVVLASAVPATPPTPPAAKALVEVVAPVLPSKEVDADALQKPNRSAKGGKLTAAGGATAVAGEAAPPQR